MFLCGFGWSYFVVFSYFETHAWFTKCYSKSRNFSVFFFAVDFALIDQNQYNYGQMSAEAWVLAHVQRPPSDKVRLMGPAHIMWTLPSFYRRKRIMRKDKCSADFWGLTVYLLYMKVIDLFLWIDLEADKSENSIMLSLPNIHNNIETCLRH